jgi:putative DNA methylase
MNPPMPETKYRKKLIEVALPLEAINRESAREKSIRHGSGHPSTLHIWWARRPLAIARAVLFAQLVDDPSAWPERFPTEEEQESERKRLFHIIEEMVPWEASNNEAIIGKARREIAQSWARNHPSEKAERVLHEKATTDEINDYLANELPPVHDPFAGGGTIPLEAQRLGLRAIASDLNPVAVLINKALIEIPQRFAGSPPVNPESRANAIPSKKSGKRSTQTNLAGTDRKWKGAQGLAEDVRYYGNWIRDQAQRRIGHLYPDVMVTPEMAHSRPELKVLVGERLTVIAWLWARTVASPDPAFSKIHVPLISTFWLASNKGKETWLEPVIEGATYRFEVRTGAPKDPKAVAAGTKMGRGANFRCLLSGSPISPEYIKSEGAVKRIGTRLIAIATEGKRGRIYLNPTSQMEAIAGTAKPAWVPEGDVPARLTGGTCHGYGLTTWADLFTSRQLVALTTFSDLVLEARERAVADASAAGFPQDPAPLYSGGRGAAAYGDALATYLAFARSLLLDDLVTLANWRPTNGTGSLGHAFSRQAIPMTWDFPEANPFSGTAGDLAGSVRAVALCLERLLAESAPGESHQLDACAPAQDSDRGPAILCTDPPYYDNIGYADLADFFYCWLRRTLRRVFPLETSTVVSPKREELVASPYRHGSKDAAQRFFLDGMTRALCRLLQASTNEIPTAIYYAFKQAESDTDGHASTGWETFLESVLRAGFSINGTWPTRSERLHGLKQGINALSSSIVLVCAPRSTGAATCTKSDIRRALRQELPVALRVLQHGNIAPVDVAQAALGPGMAIFSRYAKVLEADGSPMTVRAALQLINEVLDEYLTAQEGELDSDSRFAVTWYENHAFDAGQYGEAETLAKARAVAVAGLAEAGILKSGGGKVRLLKRSELPDDWDPAKDSRLTVWEATQHLIKRLDEQGEAAAAELLVRLGSLAGAARDLAYRLYSTCERKRWAEEAQAYNGLVVAWPDLERLASQAGEPASTPAQQRLL